MSSSAFFFSALKINLIGIVVFQGEEDDQHGELGGEEEQHGGLGGDDVDVEKKDPPPRAVPQLWGRTWDPKNVNDGTKMIRTARSPDRSRGLSRGGGIDLRME